ncbi:MAG: diacylglycerol kinase family lipid kinase [Hyphomicrobiales bacterium]|nr:diacylglycerol kinase family lipid kinase [Hyphomicrobiales bacterium]
MNFLMVLNKDGGTFRSLDVEDFIKRTRRTLEDAGHTVKSRIVTSKELALALEEAERDESTDVVMAGGGDGTVSAAATSVMGSGKVLAVLPAGTMNLFARSLGIPLSLDGAIAAFAAGRIRNADIAIANGRPFVHQFSVGMHPRIVEMRSRMAFSSRLGKIGASLRAALDTIRNPVRLKVTIEMPHNEIVARTAGISISNNLYGEGHLPYADRPDGGVLGVYITSASRRHHLLLLCLTAALGRWRASDRVEIHETETVILKIESRRRQSCVIDGELRPLEPETKIRILPGALKVLVPDNDEENTPPEGDGMADIPSARHE